MIKIGITRYQQTEDMCPGTMDFIVASEGKMAFAETGPAEIVGFVSCGGCLGKRAVSMANLMGERGAQAIVLASCISKGNPIDFPCPHYAENEGEHSQKNWAWYKDNRVDALSSFFGSDGHKSTLAVTFFKGFYCTNLLQALEYSLMGGDMVKIQAS